MAALNLMRSARELSRDPETTWGELEHQGQEEDDHLAHRRGELQLLGDWRAVPAPRGGWHQPRCLCIPGTPAPLKMGAPQVSPFCPSQG